MVVTPESLTPQCLHLLRVMSTSKWPLKVSEERVQMYRARRNQYLSAAITDGDHEPEVDPYAFEEGDVKFTFSNKKDKAGGEREPGKKHKVKCVIGLMVSRLCFHNNKLQNLSLLCMFNCTAHNTCPTPTRSSAVCI